MKQKKKYRQMVWLLLFLDMLAILWAGYDYLEKRIPDTIYVQKNHPYDLEEMFSCAWVDFEDSIEAVAGNKNTTVACRIFGKIPYKEITILPIEEKEVFASGSTIGIYMEAAGVLVVDTGEILSESGELITPAKNILLPGDYIVAVNQKKIRKKSELIDQLSHTTEKEIQLSINRDGELLPVSVAAVKDINGAYKLGIWVRDDTQGIGTLTYVEEDGSFGALGHGISDTDTGELFRISSGNLYRTKVLGILKGMKGIPGEISGVIHYEEQNIIGEIKRNTDNGIYGMFKIGYEEGIALKKYPIGLKQELNLGKAQILCCIQNQVAAYEVEILSIDMGHSDTNKSFVIKVKDERLLEETGGIVQGMSGSPILQNGKLVGAVTHVFVNDPTKGYGIFIENMLK